MVVLALSVLVAPILVTHATQHGVSVLGPTRTHWLIGIVRDRNPSIHEPVAVGQAIFVGPRSIVKYWAADARYAQIKTPSWTIAGKTTAITVRNAIKKDEQRVDCITFSEGRSICTDLEKSAYFRANVTERDVSIPDIVMLSRRQGSREQSVSMATISSWARRRCELHLNNLPAPGLSVSTDTRCTDDSITDAHRLRMLLLSWFKTN